MSPSPLMTWTRCKMNSCFICVLHSFASLYFFLFLFYLFSNISLHLFYSFDCFSVPISYIFCVFFVLSSIFLFLVFLLFSRHSLLFLLSPFSYIPISFVPPLFLISFHFIPSPSISPFSWLFCLFIFFFFNYTFYVRWPFIIGVFFIVCYFKYFFKPFIFFLFLHFLAVFGIIPFSSLLSTFVFLMQINTAILSWCLSRISDRCGTL